MIKLLLCILMLANCKAEQTTEKSPGPCAGWCIKDNPVNVAKIKSHIKDKKLSEKLALIEKQVEKQKYFQIKAGMNLYADRNQLANRYNMKTMLRQKNVVPIPSAVFFPYTKRMLRKLLMESGHIYIPKRKSDIDNGVSAIMSAGFVPFLSRNMVAFSNRYFEKNPLLHSKFAKPLNKVKLSGRSKYNGLGTDKGKDKRSDLIQKNTVSYSSKEVRPADLEHFIGYTDRRSLGPRSAKIKQLLETNRDTILDDPQNALDDIVGAMKIGGRAKHTFIFGKNKDAVKDLNMWMGRFHKSRSANLIQGNGYVISDRIRAKAVNRLLKSMLQNYQYGSSALRYKKF